VIRKRDPARTYVEPVGYRALRRTDAAESRVRTNRAILLHLIKDLTDEQCDRRAGLLASKREGATRCERNGPSRLVLDDERRGCAESDDRRRSPSLDE